MRALGEVAPEEPVEVSVLLLPRLEVDTLESLQSRLASGAPPLTREEFAARYGAAPEAIERVRAFAAAHGLDVVSASSARRTVVLRGSARQIGQAFGVRLQRYASPDGQSFHAPDREPRVPVELSGDVEAVFGLDSRRVAEHHQARIG
jgi:kumamolisin